MSVTKRFKKKLEKENVLFQDFIREYHYYNRIPKLKNLSNKIIQLRKEKDELEASYNYQDIVISKTMYFSLIGYLPLDIKTLLDKVGKFEIELPKLLGKVFIPWVNNGAVCKIEEELYLTSIESTNKPERKNVKFTFKGFGIDIIIPVISFPRYANINGARVAVRYWDWDFSHCGLHIISDVDFSACITATQAAKMLGEAFK